MNAIKRFGILCGFIFLSLFVVSPTFDQCNAGRGNRGYNGSSERQSVPEPSTVFLLAAGAGALYVARRWYKK